jgi:hypothetical protein
MRRKAGDYNWSEVTPEQQKRLKQFKDAEEQRSRLIEEKQNAYISAMLTWHFTKRNIECAPMTGILFIDACSERISEAQKKRSKEVLPRDEFLHLVEQFEITDMDIVKVARYALVTNPQQSYRDLGKAILLAASRVGIEAASIRIMFEAYIQSQDKPKMLDSSEINHAREHLRTIANKREDFRAMVLQGNIDYAKGRKNSAIRLWTEALEPAIQHAKAWQQYKKPENVVPDLENLTSPWIELANVHEWNHDYREAKQAFTRGVEVDDPNSHFQAAMYFRREEQPGVFLPTSKYLYHMTKAAASGWVPAMHALGLYYSGNSWPYIEDDPPDYVKPTPFDRYPSERNVVVDVSTWTRIRAALGWGSLSTRESKDSLSDTFSIDDDDGKPGPADDVFHTAAFPHDVKGRYQMALQWFNIAMGFHYAPSYLVAARLHLEERLGDDLAAPWEAVQLRKSRYTYASRADYEAGRPIKGLNPPPPPKMVRNPFYNPEKAMDYIREMFYANGALNARMDYMANHRRARRQQEQQGRHVFENFSQVRAELPANLDKWFELPDLYQHWMDEKKGVLRDTTIGYTDMVAEARKICDDRRWDVYAEHDGGLLYRHMGRR